MLAVAASDSTVPGSRRDRNNKFVALWDILSRALGATAATVACATQVVSSAARRRGLPNALARCAGAWGFRPAWHWWQSDFIAASALIIAHSTDRDWALLRHHGSEVRARVPDPDLAAGRVGLRGARVASYESNERFRRCPALC